MRDQPRTSATAYDEPPFDPPAATEPPPPDDVGPPPAPTPGDDPVRRPDRENDSTPPQDTIAEQAVLGALLLNPSVIPAVTAILSSSDYYRPEHERIHDAILALAAAGHPVDPITVVDELRNRGHLVSVGGAPYLHTLTASVPMTSASAAEHYAGIVRTTARRRALITTGTRLVQAGRAGTSTDLDSAYTVAYDALDTGLAAYGPTAHVATSWSPVNLDRVLEGDYLDPPPTMLRRMDKVALLYAGAVHTISGESESGKTWLTLLAALQELEQNNAVTFLDFEDRADRVVARLLALGAHPDAIRERFAYVRPDRPLDDPGRAQLTPALTGRSLVIVDGVTEAMTTHGLDLNSNADSATFQALIPRWIADHGPAVVLIDHVVKNKDEQGRFAIGAQHKLAGIDGAAYVVKNHTPFARGKRGVSQIIVAKDRPGHVREQAHGKTIATFALDASHDGNVLVAELMAPETSHTGPDGASWEPTIYMERVSRFIAANPKASKKTIETMVNGKAAVIRTALELLVLRDYVSTIAGPRGAIQHVSVTPYLDESSHPDDDPDQPPPHLTGDTPDHDS